MSARRNSSLDGRRHSVSDKRASRRLSSFMGDQSVTEIVGDADHKYNYQEQEVSDESHGKKRKENIAKLQIIRQAEKDISKVQLQLIRLNLLQTNPLSADFLRWYFFFIRQFHTCNM